MAAWKWTCCMTVLSIVVGGNVLFLSGCSRKDNETANNDQIIASLKEQINELKAQIQTLQHHLDLERSKLAVSQQETTTPNAKKSIDGNLIQFSRMDSNDPNQTIQVSQDPNSEGPETLITGVVSKIIEGGLGQDETVELALLKEENKRLKKELERLQLLLIQEDRIVTGYQNAEEVSREFELRRSPVRKIDFLESLSQLSEERDPTILPTIQKALDSLDPDVAIAASRLLKNYKSAEVLPVVEQALLSSNDEVRVNALEPLGNIDDPLAVDFLINALNDKSEAVRSQVLEIAGDQEGEIELAVLSAAMNSLYDDVRYEALSLLEFRGDSDVVPILIEGLKDPDLEYVEETNSVLSFLIDQEFLSYEDATSWWEQNKDRYDEDLFEK
ncbi:hypothetical protein ES703_111213 [subsurface metagenome]